MFCVFSLNLNKCFVPSGFASCGICMLAQSSCFLPNLHTYFVPYVFVSCLLWLHYMPYPSLRRVISFLEVTIYWSISEMCFALLTLQFHTFLLFCMQCVSSLCITGFVCFLYFLSILSVFSIFCTYALCLAHFYYV